MGRHRNRKKDRQVEQRSWPRRDGVATASPPHLDFFDDDLLVAFQARTETPAETARSCGNCREFVLNEETCRGECLHPGSGYVSPWPDTPGCPFYARARR
jgi:hypothetical protein